MTIVADPRIAPTLTQLVEQLPDTLCADPGVSAAASADVVADVTRAKGRGLGGLVPDLWVPASWLWLDRAEADPEGATRLAEGATILASTPVVLAADQAVAEAAGWQDSPPTWGGLVTGSSEGTRVGLTDLTTDAAALAAASAAGATTTARLQDLAGTVVVARSPRLTGLDLLEADTADVVPSTEQEIAEADATGLATPVVAEYDESLGRLDFPLAEVAPLDGQLAPAVRRVRDALLALARGQAGQRLLAQGGFRDPDGVAAAAMATGNGLDPSAPAGESLHDSAGLVQVAASWPQASRRSRLLVAVDLSGSMGELLPSGTQTRADAAQAGLRALVDASPPDSEMGVWGFTTLVGNGDYEVLTPLGPLDRRIGTQTRRQELLGQIGSLDAIPGGSTSLYDTVAAAYDAASRQYAFGKYNALVVLTDGRNEDPGSLTLAQLLDRLQARFDGTRPVRIVTIAYGGDADTATLRAIADATGGTSFTALTGAQIGQTFAALAAQE
ncbi:MAG: VWA domain-containing protein [Nocardioides sp.]